MTEIEDGNVPSEFSIQEVLSAAENSLDFFAGLAAPEECSAPFADFHKVIWQLLTDALRAPARDASFAIGVPRGFAKTHLIKLLTAWTFLHTHHRFILTIGATGKLAQNIVGDASAFLDAPNIQSIYGNWRIGIETDNIEEKVFNFRGKTNILRGQGAGSAVRGINKGNARPSVIIMDDMQDLENSQSPEQAEQLFRWMRGTLLKAGSPHGCIRIYIGNMYPTVENKEKQPCCILRRLQKDRNWTSLIAGCLVYSPSGDLISLWEDVHPKEKLLRQLQEDMEAGTTDIFFSEMMNDPECKSLSGSFDLSKIQVSPWKEEFDLGQFIIIDLATDKKNSDDVVILRVARQMEKHVAVEAKVGRFSPTEIIDEALQMATTHGVSVIAVESVNFQYAMLHFFQLAMQKLNLQGIQCVELQPRGVSKNQRIRLMFTQLQDQSIHISPELIHEVKNQILQFNPRKTDNRDDLLDCLAYITQVEKEYGPIIHRVFRQEHSNMDEDYLDCLPM